VTRDIHNNNNNNTTVVRFMKLLMLQKCVEGMRCVWLSRAAVHADITVHVSFPFHFKAAKGFFAHVKQIEYISTILQRLALFLLLD
jgi:hypothetical protein